jgi:hypothetical protein
MKLVVSFGILLGLPGALFAALPSTLGWYQIPNTKIDSVCAGTNGFPEVLGVEGCPAILSWSGGVLDSTRNRLIVWGGGHNAYYGNELYAINLGTLTVQRLNNPGLPLALCTTATANGTQAASRHTYDGIEYMPNVDRMFVFGGAIACGSGGSTNDTWTFSFATMTWQLMNPSGPTPSVMPGTLTAYDPNTGLVFLHDNVNLFSYNFSTNSYTRLSNNSSAVGYSQVATIDPVRKKFVMVGYDTEVGSGRVYSYDIGPGSSYVKQTLSTSGGSGIIGTQYPGLDFDPVSGRIVTWNGGDTVYSLNLDTNQWTTVTYSGGPGAASPTQGRGTHGRWRYSPASNAFILVNNTNQDAYAFRLTSGSGSPPPADTTPPTTPGSLTASASSSSQMNLSWTASTDNVGVAGYQLERCTGSGCTNFSQVAAPSGPSYSDGGLTASTTYVYRVRATDGAGNFSGYSSTVSATTQSASAPQSGGSDFATRCAATGVVKCVGFDSPSEVAGGYGDPSGILSGPVTAPTLDTTMSASGASSLKFTIPANTVGGGAGTYFTNFSNDLSVQFGENSEFFIQWRQRFSPEFIFGAGWKQAIIGTGDKTGCSASNSANCYSSCTALEVVAQNTYARGFVQLYNSCTGSASHGPYDPFVVPYGSFDFKLQNARPSPYCLYSQASGGYFPPAGNCFGYFPNEWMTFQISIKTGSRVNNEFTNSFIKLWVARAGQASELVFDFGPYNLTAGSLDENQLFGKIWLLPYSGSDPFENASSTWYDELIISRSKIPDPGISSSDTTPPAAPTNLTSN